MVFDEVTHSKCTSMPCSPNNIEEIHNTLKASLHRGSKQQNLDQDVVAASKRVLLEHIEFEPSSSPYTMQLDQLRSKYISLNAGSATSASASFGKSTNGAGEISHQFAPSNGSAVSPGGGDSLPQPKVILYPEERVKMEWLRQGRIGAGLVNMGNTCFFNSTLQCLTYTAPLVNYCFSNDHKQKCTKNGFCMMCEIQNHIRTSLDCGGKSIKPHSILQKLRCIAKHMKWGRQEDAHEFLRFVVDHLQQACLNGHAKLDRFSKETTVINQIFGGYLQSQVICLRCQAKSNTFDPFMDLSLDIKGVNTVEEALTKFVKPETLDQENAYKCPKCKHKVRAQKRFTIYKAPNVLTLQLNRFDFNRHLSGKINRFIRYTEKINLRNFMSQRQGEPILYHLYGVLVHSGHSSEHGHYYSFVKSPSKIWYCMNDSIVHQAGNNSVFSADAYVLFYARINRNVGASNKNATPATASTSNHINKDLSTPHKESFIGPIIPKHLKQSSSPMVNGLHGTPSSEQGTPVKRQQPVMMPRALQTSSKSAESTMGPSTVAPTPQATAASSLPGSHNRISFPVLSHTQKRQQQQQQQLKVQHQVNQTSEDSKHIVLQIKHGNSTTMEKSPDGKSKLVDKKGSEDSIFLNEKNAGQAKPHGLVPYGDDDDSDSDNDHQRLPRKPVSHNQEKQKVPNVTSSALSGGLLNTGNGPLPASTPQKLKLDSESPSNPSGSQIHSSLQNAGRNPGPISKTGVAVPSAEAKSMSSSLLSLPHSKSDERVWSGTRPQSTNPNFAFMTASVSSGKSGTITPLELPGVFTSHSSPNTVIKTSNGPWHVQPQDTVPSPRGSCSSANSVNSTTEWTLQSKGKSDRGNHGASKNECEDSWKMKSLETLKSQQKSKSPLHHINNEKVESNGNGNSQSSSNSQPAALPSNKPSPVPSFPALARPETPVDISDRQELLSSPHNSGVGDCGRYSKKRKKQKDQYKEERDEKEKKRKKETNGWSEYSRSSSLDSNDKRKKKHKHKKEKRKRRDRSTSNSESEREERHREIKKHHRSDISAYNRDDSPRRHKHKSQAEDSDGYEWVEVTKESSVSKYKGSNKTASVQMWNHHVKDDIASRKDSDISKVKSTWDGSRHSKASVNLHGSSYSLGSNVLSWDGNKNHLDRELQTERAANKRHWSEEYNQEIDAGKVKKVKSHKHDSGFQGSNPFQKYQEYQTDKVRDKHREWSSSWSQDHSYHQHNDHHYHKSWHRKSNGDGYKKHAY
ncbi:ubiquitin carboxyl-terminal hydrolase 36 [Plakobranchus ocellatus]|uniref:Ubiquitin carboxyl-terminal hydrolase 36 n=1 Tax=Plakobranchus ocellatus TaxID=259542 RepID=A0AAV4D3M3_9GAST|nr:ubiquitin carboxyl-terminal hydrolase 36 [Plakobranchus ocellatus]